MAHHFILLWLNLFDLRVDVEGWWFEYSVSQLRVCLLAEDAKSISWPWSSPFWRWGSLLMSLTVEFLSMAHKFILLWLNPFDLRVDGERWCFEHSVSQFHSCGFACQQSVVKTFPDPLAISTLKMGQSDYVTYWYICVSVYIYIYILYIIYIYIYNIQIYN